MLHSLNSCYLINGYRITLIINVDISHCIEYHYGIVAIAIFVV